MARFIVRRVCFAVVLVVVASSAALLLTRLAPGDATMEVGQFPSEREAASARTKYGLDRDPVSQWSHWVLRAVRFDLGHSSHFNQPVAPLVARAALNTFILAVVALALATCVGVASGVVTGSRGGSIPAIIRGISLAAVSMPPLLTSLMLVFVAARTGWFPAGSMTSVQAMDLTWSGWAADVARHLALPVVALALPMAATFERLQSQAISEALRQPFVVAAAARGASPRDLILRHAWRVSVRPLCGVYGIAVGALLSGSFAVEYITAWPGLGRLMYDALYSRDIYLVAGCAAAGACFLALGTLSGDVLLAMADPRVREDPS
jgi:peptide/nickel transport system permease protein